MRRSSLARLRASVLALASVAALSASAPRDARANMAAPVYEPSSAGPLIAPKTPLRVTEERLSFDCKKSQDDDAICDFEARYAFVNPSSARAETLVAFLTEGAVDVRLELDGKVGSHPLTAEEAKSFGLDAAAVHLGDEPREGDDERGAKASSPTTGTPAIAIAADPGTHHELVARGRLPAGRAWSPRGYASDAILARHVALAHEPITRQYPFRYELWPMRTWADDPTIHVRVRYPSAWDFAQVEKGWTTSRDGGAKVATKDLKLSEAGPDLALGFSEEPGPVVPGGIILGLGGAKGDFAGFRARLGYELAVPRPLLWSLTLDADFKGTAFVTPTAKLASGALWFIPSFGIGAGLPVQIAPDRRVGARVELDVQLYALGFVTSLDIFPRKHGDPLSQATFLAQITF
jgi:hypothetical protein